MQHWTAVAFFRIMILFVSCVVFQTQTQPVFAEKTRDFMQSSIEELMDIQVATVGSASKYEQVVTEAPSSVSVITADEIKTYGYRNLADILRSVRSFYITNDRNYSFVGIRGFSRPGDFNSRVLLLINGHRINDNIYDTAPVGNEFILDVDLIDKIEIIRGPSSSLYGTSAFFAIINIVTRKGSGLQGGEVSVEAGSYQTYKERLTYGNSFSSGASLLISGSYLDSAGPDRLYFRGFDSPATNHGIAERADYEKASNLFTEISFGEFTLSSGYVYRQKGIPTAPYETIFNTRKTYTVDERAYLELRYEHSFDPSTVLTARAAYDQYYYYGHYLYPPSVVNRDFSRGKWLSGEIQITTRAFDRHRIIAGIDSQFNFQQDQGNFDTTVYLDDRRHSNTVALYLQDSFTISRNLMINAGVRYDHEQTFGSSINPRIAVIYQPFTKTYLKYLFGTAFRKPNVYELYYTDGNATQKANEGLKPEKIVTHEAVIEHYFAKNLRGTASVYHYRIRNLITQQIDPADGLAVFRNAEDIEARGIELEVEKTWQRGIKGTLSYAYQKATDGLTGETLTNSPKHLAKINMSFPLIGKKLFTGTEIQYTGSRRTLSGEKAQSYVIANATLFGKHMAKGLDMSAGIYNIFNRKYDDPGGTEHQPTSDTLQQNGRNFRFKITYAF